MGAVKSNKNQSIQVISRAADILRLLGRETAGLSLGQIAAHVQLPRSTVQRIVGALAAEGLVSTGRGSGDIRLGSEIQSLAQASVQAPSDRLRPVMQQIAAETGETVDLARLQGNAVFFVDQIVGSQRLRTVSSIGETFPLTTTANGKAALACLDEAEAKRLIQAELADLAGTRPASEVLADIDGIRLGALARDENEHTEGVSALGFGVVDPSGNIFAISVPVPSSRYARVKPALISSLLKAREALSLSVA